ncbi:hypothetical protein DMENIID0001_054460 [Sergentomyia squamirostris]
MSFKHFLFLQFVLIIAVVADDGYCKHKVCQGVPEGYFLANPADCNEFFECINGRAVLGRCPDGFFFHPGLQKCEVHWQVPCAPGPELELDCVEDEGESERPEFSCPSNDVQVLQHPTNCSLYILCFHGYAHVRDCAHGLEWDTSLEQCNIPDQAQCSPSVCPFQDDPQNPVFLYNDAQCNSFAICVNGLPQWRFCALGFHWDRKNLWCTTPYQAGCEEWQEPPVEEIECHDDSPLRNPHPTECHLYFICSNRESFLRTCADGLHFDYVTRTCRNPEDSLCYATIGQNQVAPLTARDLDFDQICGIDGSSPVREHPDTCLKFVICDFNTSSLWPLPCADGHVFVRELYACVPGDVDTCTPHN